MTAATQTPAPSRPPTGGRYRRALARCGALIVLIAILWWRALSSGRSAKTGSRPAERPLETPDEVATTVAGRSVKMLFRATKRRLETWGNVATIISAFVAVAALAVAFAAYENDRGARRDSARSTSPSPVPSPSTSREGPKMAPSVKPQTVVEAYEHCAQLVRKAGSANGYRGRSLRGVFSIVNRSGTTSLVSDGRATWACNLKPDVAVSRRHRIEGPGDDYEFALARTHLFYDWDVFWGGGTLPLGVVSVTYIFPDGEHVPAQVKTGYWLVQHYSRLPLDRRAARPIRVLLLTSAGNVKEERELQWDNDVDLCNQVVHSC